MNQLFYKPISSICLKSLLPIFLFVTAGELLAQDTISRHDSQEIQFLAKRKLEKGYLDLLNILTFEDLGEFERKTIIADSYGNTLNKLFYDNLVVIEDDINPEHKSASNTMDLPVEKYLNNFELFYPKSTDRTIQFSDFMSSALKKLQYYYVKVYFTSHFGSKHKQSGLAYEKIRRVAEVRAEKNGKKWQVYISRIAFVPEGDSITATLNNVVVTADPNLAEGAVGESISSAEKLREKEREEERAALVAYNEILSVGDKAFLAKDYEKALEAYTEAEKRNQFDDLLPRRKIYKVKQAFEREKETDIHLVKQYLVKAVLAERKRNYSEAIGYYKKVLDIKPDSIAVQNTIKILNQKSGTKTELDEKYNSGKYAEVIKDYSRIIKREKSNPDLYLGRGLAYFKMNEPQKALKDFTQSIELDFNNLAAIRARAELFMSQKDFPKAAADLTTYLNIDGTDHEMYFLRALMRIETRNLKGAIEDNGRAIILAPKNSAYLLKRATIYDQIGDNLGAANDLTAAINLNNEFSDAYYQRGISYLKLNDLHRAGKDFKRLKELKITSEQEKQIDLIASEYFSKAYNTLSGRESKKAVLEFDELLLIKPEMPEAWFHRGTGLLTLGDTLAGIESLNQAISHRKDYHEAYFQRALVFYRKGEFGNAAADFRETARIHSTAYLASIGEGEAYFALSAYDKLIPVYEFIKLNEQKIGKILNDSIYATAYDKLGLAYFRTGKTLKAIEEFDRAIEKKEHYSEAYMHRGNTYLALENLKRAISDFKRAAELDQENPYAHQMLGQALEKDEKFEEAVKSYSLAIDHDPSNNCCKAFAHAGKALSNYRLGRFADAIQDYISAFELNPATQTNDALLNTGYSHIQVGASQDAVKYLSLIAPGSPVRGESYYALGCAFLQMHYPEEAFKWFEKSFRTGLITKSFIRQDKVLDRIDRSFSQQSRFKDLITQNVIR